MLIAIIIALYILEANSVTVPIGCFIAAWVLIGIRCVACFMEGFIDSFVNSLFK